MEDEQVRDLVQDVLLPHSQMHRYYPQLPPAGAVVCSTLIRNASAVLRNVSSDGADARNKLRDCPNLVDCTLYLLRVAIAQHDIDNKSVENCMCMLRNLSYACQEVQDPHYLEKREIQLAKQHQEMTGGFRRKRNKKRKQDTAGAYVPSIGEPVRGRELLWDPEVLSIYLPLLSDCTNPETLEAAADAIQNLTACDWQPSVIIRAEVRTKKALPILIELLNLEADRVACASATALRNLVIDPKNNELIGKYAMKELVAKLPAEQPERNEFVVSNETVCAVETTIYDVIKSNEEQARRMLMQTNGIERLMFITNSHQRFSPKVVQFASTILYTLWQYKDMRGEYKQRRWSKQHFITKTKAANEYGVSPSRNAVTPIDDDSPSHLPIYDSARKPRERLIRVVSPLEAPDSAVYNPPEPSAPPASRPGTAQSSNSAATAPPTTTVGPTPAATTSSTRTTTTTRSTTTSTPTTTADTTTTATTPLMMIQERTKEKYWCFCEFHKFIPFCKIPNKHPKICTLGKRACITLYVLLVVCAITAVIIPVAVTQTGGGCAGGLQCGDGECYNKQDICNGVDFCDDRRDEQGCVPKFVDVPEAVAVRLSHEGFINCEIIRGDQDVEVFYINEGEQTRIWTSKNRNRIEHGYFVDSSSRSHTYGIGIEIVDADNANYIIGVGFQNLGKRQLIDLIVTDSWTCSLGSTAIEGDAISMTATVNYYGVNEPTMFFSTRISSQIVSATTITDHDSYYTKEITYTTEASYMHNGYIFLAYMLTQMPQTQNSDGSWPSAQYCSVTYVVEYGARNAVISYYNQQTDPNVDDILLGPGSELMCYAIGNPLPIFWWACNSGAYTFYGYQMYVPYEDTPEEMRCTCTAYNVVDNRTTYEDSISLNFVTHNATAAVLQTDLCLFMAGSLLIVNIV